MDTSLKHAVPAAVNQGHPTTATLGSGVDLTTRANDTDCGITSPVESRGAPSRTRTLQAAEGRYRFYTFTREEDPSRALRVEQIHGECYVAAGFVKPSALDSLGRLDNSDPAFILDKARGSTELINVRYMHAVPTHAQPGPPDEAGLRVVSVTEGASLDDLGAISACRTSLGRIYRNELYETFERLGPQGVKEITSLSITTGAHCSVPYALMREALRHALLAGTDEKWVITFALPAFHSLRRRLGELVIHPAGELFYAHRDDDPRTSNDVMLVPTIIETKDCIENVARSIALADNHKTAYSRFDTLAYMVGELDEQFLGPLTRRILRDGM